jgi:hypothetical protein
MSTPIVVRAYVPQAVYLPTDSVMLDALLAAAVATRDQIPPALTPGELVPIDVPLVREPEGRFHLASAGHYEIEQYEARHIHKRTPIEEYKRHGKRSLGSVSIASGPDKPSRIPVSVAFVKNGTFTWWAVAVDADEIRSLLGLILSIGKRRGVGNGIVQRWEVEPVEPWGPGFPVVLPDGTPTRNLPLDWPGVREDAPQRWGCLTYPYWLRPNEQQCYAPESAR